MTQSGHRTAPESRTRTITHPLRGIGDPLHGIGGSKGL